MLYKENFKQNEQFLNSFLVSRFIDYMSFDNFLTDKEYEYTPTSLQEKLNTEIQIFIHSYNTFNETPDIQNKIDLLNILTNMRKSLRFFANIHVNNKIFISDFPYQELFYSASYIDDQTINFLSFECLSISIRTDLNFDISIIPDFLVQKLLSLISDCFNIDSIDIVIDFISILIQNSPHLCNLFILNGLFHIFDDWIQAPFCILALESVILTSDSKHIPTILIYCKDLLTSKNIDLINKSFHCFSIFIHRFGFRNINKKNRLLLFKIIPKHIKTLKSAIELCTLFPAEDPPDIFNQILEILSEPVVDSEFHIICLSLMIHFSSVWTKCMKKEDIYSVLFFGAEQKEFVVSVKFVECIIFYHFFDDFSFDMSVLQICLNFLDSEIYVLCLSKIYEIITFDSLKFPNQISKMFNLFDDDIIDQINIYSNENEIAQLTLAFLSSKLSDKT